MRHVHVDAPDLVIARKDQPDLLGCLDEIERRRSTVGHEAGNARRHAARGRREGDLAREHFVIVLLHVLLHPRVQVRIAEIGDPIGRLGASAVVDERMRGIVGNGRNLARDGIEVRPALPDPNPPELVRRKVRRSRLLLRRDRGGQPGAHEDGQGTASKKPSTRSKCSHGSFPGCGGFRHVRNLREFCRRFQHRELRPDRTRSMSSRPQRRRRPFFPRRGMLTSS